MTFEHANVLDLDDIRMVDRSGDARLTKKPLNAEIVGDTDRRQHLQGNIAT